MAIVDRRLSVVGDVAVKPPCRVATAANVALSGLQTIDGVALAADDRVLVKDQTDGAQNGIYSVSTGNWTRTRDCDGAYDMVTGTLVRVTAGTTNKGMWELTTAGTITIDTTALTFAMISNTLAGVSALVQLLFDDTTAAEFFATLGTVAEPAGTVKAYAGTSEPTGYLFCYGQAISRTTYAALFDVIGAIYGNGDGSTTFNLPDLRGRVVAGQDDMGGTSADRLTAQTNGVNGDTLGATGGAETHTLTAAQLAAHKHTITDPSHTHNINTGALSAAQGGTFGGSGINVGTGIGVVIAESHSTGITETNNSTGGDGAHNNVQPTIILNYIIKT